MDARPRKNYGMLRLADILVVLIFLSAAALSFRLFWNDLFQSLESRDEEPVGVIVIKKNVVQRRFSDRSLWDRLFVESPVYSEDLIRVADLSAATLHVDKNSLDLNENTLIRIRRAEDEKAPVEIELNEGNISLISGDEGSGLMLNLFGSRVQAGPGTVLNAAAGEEGMVVQVSEGTARFIGEGQSRELTEGTMLAMDPEGAEVIRKAAVVTRPAPNARFLKNTGEPLTIGFVWNRINLEDDDTLRLEISGDRNYSQILMSFETEESRAEAHLEAGLWYWRLSHGDAVLSTGRFTVADASGPELTSPVTNSVFRFFQSPPQIRFQWSSRPGASYYVLEISETRDFSIPHTSRQTAAVSFISSDLGEGNWYWRVRPVFPEAYEGSAAYSSAASFRIERTGDPEAPHLELPEPVSAPQAPAQNTSGVTAALPVPGRNYTVRRGDTLVQMAVKAYGSASKWTLIANANSIINPDRIEPGEIFFIPFDDTRNNREEM